MTDRHGLAACAPRDRAAQAVVEALGKWFGWDNTTSTNTVTTLTPGADPFVDEWTVGSQAFTGSTVSARTANGTYGRWGYFPNLKGFCVVNSVTEAGFFLAIP